MLIVNVQTLLASIIRDLLYFLPCPNTQNGFMQKSSRQNKRAVRKTRQAGSTQRIKWDARAL
jgi:hypothetical protein